VLVCPSCATGHDDGERFCGRCGLPLVHAGAEEAAEGGGTRAEERRERARKIRPQYAEGRLVRVASARNQAEAELLQGMLLEEGVPSMTRRSVGFDVPDFLASGPRDILVPESGAEAARDVFGVAEPPGGPEPAAGGGVAPWVRALAAALAVLIAALLAAGLYEALSL
jgi:hypothetical protein